MLSPPNPDLLRPFAHRYIWWETPEKAVKYPEHVVAQVMNNGNLEAIQAIEKTVGKDYLKHVLTTAEIGMFSPASWHFWHYRLEMVQPDQAVPPMPIRKVA